jgi:antitoxin (DNA-binding transcriptional repressor) of toxin-antitoxin stability system
LPADEGRGDDLDTWGDQSHHTSMKYIAAAKFKETCLALLDEVDPDGIVITKRGKPVAKLIPFGTTSSGLIGALAGKVVIKGDLLSTGVDWDAQP